MGPRGVPQIEVKFDIDANGILGVTAIDKGSNKQADIKITGASTLSDDEVNRMVNEAEKNAAEDGKKREEVDTKNQADSMVYQTEKQLQELGDKVPAEMKTKVEGKLAELKEAVASGSMEGMKAAQDSLQQEVMAMGQSMYSQGGGAEGGAAPGAEGEGSAPPAAPQRRRRRRRRLHRRRVDGYLPRQGAGERDVQRSETLERDCRILEFLQQQTIFLNVEKCKYAFPTSK